jgi:hypothetical protein
MAPDAGESDVIAGATCNVNEALLLVPPRVVTVVDPFAAPVGIVAVMLVADHAVVVAVAPPIVTTLDPCDAPKLVPAMVRAAPFGAVDGDRLVIVGAGITVNASALLIRAFAVTVTLPLVAPAGTGATIDVALQLVGVAVTPPIERTPEPCVAPKFAPEIVIACPIAPLDGDSDVNVGDGTGVGSVTVES